MLVSCWCLIGVLLVFICEIIHIFCPYTFAFCHMFAYMFKVME